MAIFHHYVRQHAASFKRKGKQMGGGVTPVNAAFFADGTQNNKFVLKTIIFY